MRMSRIVATVLLLTVAATSMPRPSIAASPSVLAVTQTVRSAQYDNGGVRGAYLTSYTAAGLRTPDWDLRASLSWLAWRDDGGDFVTSDESGPGSVFLNVGRRVLTMRSDNFSAVAWLRLKGKIPLQEEFDATGTGEFDWGGSVYTALRLGDVSLLAEVGRLDLGSPTGVDDGSTSSISAVASYARPGSRFYPLVGFAHSTSLRAGDPAFREWSLGLGAILLPGFSVTGLYSWGATDISPTNSVSISAWVRL